MTRVLWVDPGLKTGIALFDSHQLKVDLFAIIPGGLEGFKNWWNYAEIPKFDVMGCESFELEEGTHGIEYEAPLQIIHYLQELGVVDVWQRRNQRGKNSVARIEVLKRAGLYPKRGELKKGHQVAALQHLLAYLLRQRDLKTVELLHPKELPNG